MEESANETTHRGGRGGKARGGFGQTLNPSSVAPAANAVAGNASSVLKHDNEATRGKGPRRQRGGTATGEGAAVQTQPAVNGGSTLHATGNGDTRATRESNETEQAGARRGRRRGRGGGSNPAGAAAGETKMTPQPVAGAASGPTPGQVPSSAERPPDAKGGNLPKQRRNKNRRDKGGLAEPSASNTQFSSTAGAKTNGLVVDRVSKGDTVGRVTDVRPEEATAKDYYFDSYAHHGIHEEMIKDHVRTNAYRDAIMGNQAALEGKVVLDVGCGTAILSMFAARAGARHVYAVECSGIIHLARQIVEANGMQDRITLIHGKVEDVQLPVDKVDVIVSEWMGYALLYESMLDSVIFARDKWLAADGLMLPDKASLFMLGIEDMQFKKDKVGFWKDVYGFDMSSIQPTVLAEPIVDIVPLDSVCTKPCQIKSFDLRTVTKHELAFKAPFRLSVSRNDYLTAWVLYFEVGFSALPQPVWISTSPRAQATHWRQAVFYLDQQLTVTRNEAVSGELSLRQNHRNPRDLDFTISYVHSGKVEGRKTGSSEYRMR